MPSALTGLGAGLAQGKAGAQKDQIQKDYYDSLKKHITSQIDFEQRKMDLLNSLPPEQQAKAAFPSLKTDPKDEAIAKILPMLMDQMGMGMGGDQGLVAPGSEPGPATGQSLLPQELANLAIYADKYHGFQPGTMAALIQAESRGDPGAISPKGAKGLTQLMPETQAEMGVRDPFNPQESVMGGAGYLKKQLDRFGGDYPKAYAAYNTGPETVEQKGITPEAQAYLGKIRQYLSPKPRPLGGGGTIDPRTAFALNVAGLKTDALERNFRQVGDDQVLVDKFGNVVGHMPGPQQFEQVTVEDASGRQTRQNIPKAGAHLGGAAIPAPVEIKPGGIDPQKAAQKNVISHAANKLSEMNGMIFKGGDLQKGDINYQVIAEAKAGIGEGSVLLSKFRQSIWGVLRPESGAVISPEEIENAVLNYMPTLLDLAHPKRDMIVRAKLKDFNQYVQGLASLTDPNDQIAYIRNRGGPKTQIETTTSEQPKTMIYDPKTGTFTPK